MASQDIFAQYPPFPDDVPTADVPSISLGKLVSGDAAHSRELFEICRTVGFFLLDLTDDASGQAVLQSINEVLGIAKDVFDLDEEEKYQFRQDASKGNFVGYGYPNCVQEPSLYETAP
jgi:isopenicillin N synthase-like dioxygenase